MRVDLQDTVYVGCAIILFYIDHGLNQRIIVRIWTISKSQGPNPQRIENRHEAEDTVSLIEIASSQPKQKRKFLC